MIYLPDANYWGTDVFSFSVSDGMEESAPATVELVVAPVNDAPVAKSENLSGFEDQALEVVLQASDVDGDELSFEIVTAPEHGELQGAGPELTYLPEADYSGLDAFTFVASDGMVASDPASVAICLAPQNDAPVAQGMSVEGREDTPAIIQLRASDAEGDALSFRIVEAPRHGVLEGVPPELLYRPNANFVGQDSFTYAVSDGQAESALATVELTMAAGNDAPVVVGEELALYAGEEYTKSIEGFDEEGDALSFEIVTQPIHGTLAIDGGRYTYAAGAGAEGTDRFGIRASDGELFSAEAVYDVSILVGNRAPEIVSAPVERFNFYRNGAKAADLRGWEPHRFSWSNSGNHSEPVWVIDDEGRSATQLYNNFAGALLSDFDFSSNRVEVDFTVGQTHDDDAIGFIWGYQSENDYYVLTWTRIHSIKGMRIYGVPGGVIELNEIAWESHVPYRFVLEFDPGEFTIEVYAEGELIERETVVDDRFVDGRFAFYAESQERVTFGNVLLGRPNAKVYQYQVAATDPDGDALVYSLSQAPEGMSIDPATGLIEWSLAEDVKGAFPVGVVATDPSGLIDEQRFLVDIIPNEPPRVEVESRSLVLQGALPVEGELVADVADDGLPGSPLAVNWSLVSGPSGVEIESADSPGARALFSQPGQYLFAMTADDGWDRTQEWVWARVNAPGLRHETKSKIFAHWSGDRTLADSVGRRDLESLNTIRYEAGRVASGLHLELEYDGYERDLSTEEGATFAEGLSLDLWVKSPQDRDLQTLLEVEGETGTKVALRVGNHAGTTRGVSLEVTQAGSVYQVKRGNGFYAGGWHHFALSLDPQAELIRLYRNGGLVGEATVPGLKLDGLGRLRLGTSLQGKNALEGVLDEVTLYDAVMDSEDAGLIYAAGGSGKGVFMENEPPVVIVNDIQDAVTGVPVPLAATMLDDGLPEGAELQTRWEPLYGPVAATLEQAEETVATASFSQPGNYGFRVTASDGLYETSELLRVRVDAPCGATADPSLLAWWAMDGDLVDEFGRSRLLPVSNPAYGPGVVGMGLQLDGVEERAVADLTPLSGSFADGFTLEFWSVFENVATDPMTLAEVAFAGGASVAVRSGNLHGATRALAVELRDVGVSAVARSGNLVWEHGVFHVAVAYDAATRSLCLYRNGELVGCADANAFDFTSPSQFGLGKSLFANEFFDGTLDEVRLYGKSLSADQVQAIFAAGSSGICGPSLNRRPSVFAGLDQAVSLPDAAELEGRAIDDGLPSGGSMAANWELVEGPEGAAIENPAALASPVRFQEPGTYLFRLTVGDGEQESSDTVTIEVAPPPNESPVVSVSGNIRGLVGQPVALHGSATDDGLPAGNTFIAKWEVVGANSDHGHIDDPFGTSPRATFDAPGRYRVRLTASDGLLSSFGELEAWVSSPPVVAIEYPSAGDIVVADTALRAIILAEDPYGSVDEVEVFLDGNPIGLAESMGVGVYEIPLPSMSEGKRSLTAIATDNEGLAASVSSLIDVLPGHPNPVASLEGPSDGLAITGPREIQGSASSGILESYTLEYRSVDSDEWTHLNEGNDTVEGGTLGLFDPTLLLNGIYELRLTVVDQIGRIAVDQIAAIVEGSLKVGQLSLAFEDLSLPVSGIPIQIVRSYDSRDSEMGDFGTGWQMALSSMRIQKNRKIGEGWRAEQEVVTLPGVGDTLRYTIRPERNNLVLLRLPDGAVEVFKAVARPDYQNFAPPRSPAIVFEPMGDTRGSLAIADENTAWVDTFSGLVDLRPDVATFEVFDPKVFRYTSKDGMVYVLSEDKGLVSVTDRNGNEITIDETGVTHSNGSGIAIARDGEGRIIRIEDPLGQALRYDYDDSGRLSRFTNRVGEAYRYLYESEAFPGRLTRIVDPDGASILASEFDAEGRLVGQTDGQGNALSFIHDIESFTETVVDRLGIRTVHTYDLEGNVIRTEIFDTEGSLVSATVYAYDERGNEIEVVDALGNVTQREFDERDNLLSESRWVADETGAALAIETRYTYDGHGNPLSITDAKGQVTRFEYDGSGNLLRQEDAAGNVTSFGYDSRGNLLSIVDPLGTQTIFSHDHRGFQTSQLVRDSAGSIVSYQSFLPDAMGRQRRVNEYQLPEGATSVEAAILHRYTEIEYDAEGRETARIIFAADGAELQVERTSYDARGNRSSQIDSGGRSTHFTYDATGNKTRSETRSASGELLREESWEYDAEGRQVAYVDPLGRRTEYAYDALGRRTDTYFLGNVGIDGADLDPADNTSTHTVYDALGRVQATVDELGNATLFEYDPYCGCSERRSRAIDALGQATTSAYDFNGNQVASANAAGDVTIFEYDRLNRLVKTIYPDGTSSETIHDAVGRRIASIDQAGRQTDYSYDAQGRLVEVLQPAPSASAPRPRTRYRYDSLGNRTEQIDAEGRSTRYEHDELGRRTKRILPKGEMESYEYDGAGNLIAKTDFNGYTTTFLYDDLDRLVQESADPNHPSLQLAHATATVTHAYDAVGNRLRSEARNASGALLHAREWSYDSRNRVTSAASDEGTLSYEYDAAGNLVSSVSSNPQGSDTRYGFDELHRLQWVDDLSEDPAVGVTGYAYDAVGNLIEMGYGNGIFHSYAYDRLNRLTRLVVSQGQGQTLASYAYTLDETGNRLEALEATGRYVSYQYDGLQRLTRETVAGDPEGFDGAVAYQFDQVGNRLSRTASGALGDAYRQANQTHAYSANDLLASDAYDANGNTTLSEDSTDGTGGRASDVYDYRDRLIRRVKADGAVVDLHYDASGNRVGKDLRADDLALREIHRFLLDANNHTGYVQVAEHWKNGVLEAVYTYGHDLISQRRKQLDPSDPSIENLATHWYLYDGHGTVRGMANASGAVTDEYAFDAFGVMLHRSGHSANDYLYTGERYDADLGMYHLRARDLNPSTGRFHTMDTYEGRSREPLTLHKYVYAHGNPVMNLDPSGRFSIVGLAETIWARSLVFSLSRFTTSAMIGIGIQARTVSIAAPLIRELQHLSYELSYFNADAARLVQSQVRVLKDLISVKTVSKSVLVPAVLASLPPPYNNAGYAWMALNAYSTLGLVYKINADAYGAINFDANGVAVSAEADLHTLASVARVIGGFRNPARDISPASSGLRYLRNRKFKFAMWMFAELSTNLSYYGHASAKIEVSIPGAKGSFEVYGSSGSVTDSASGVFAER